MRTAWSKSLALILAVLLHAVSSGQQNPNGQLPVASVAKPYLLLIRDPLVHGDLGLNADQRREVGALNDELAIDIWSMRNQSTDQIDATISAVTATAKSRLALILSPRQLRRLSQIELWTLATRAFLHDDLPDQLQLSESQRSEIRATITKTQQAINGLGENNQSGEARESTENQGRALWAKGQDEIAEVLTDQQQARWRALLGKRIDVSKLGYVKFKAPELRGQEGWINSPPLTLKELKGNVVALHFFAFG